MYNTHRPLNEFHFLNYCRITSSEQLRSVVIWSRVSLGLLPLDDAHVVPQFHEQ